MKLPRRQFLSLTTAAIGLPAFLRAAKADLYPARPVRMLVGFAAGGAPDIAARLVTQWLSDRLGQQFIIENRTGAGGNIATEAVIDAPADGYTLLMAGLQNAVNTTLYQQSQIRFRPRYGAGRRRQPRELRHGSASVVSRPRPSPNSSPTPKPIPASSTWRRPATAPGRIWPASCSRSWPASTCCTCPIAVRRRP